MVGFWVLLVWWGLGLGVGGEKAQGEKIRYGDGKEKERKKRGGMKRKGEEEGGSQSCVFVEKRTAKDWAICVICSLSVLSYPILSYSILNLSSPSKSVRSDRQRTSMLCGSLVFGMGGYRQTTVDLFAFCTSTR